MQVEDQSPAGERRETLSELEDLLHVVQEMCRRLSYETHGDAFPRVQELSALLLQARELVSGLRQAEAD
ncbi:MAG: hypothetical protein CGU28_04855 [Candidatus Dactylopiibacterium carminicum]|uniref:Uncharacterized protein n=1 Tax=Candidatus Dactylopiibacterium carminicum TaxID=857335 RepID=A0A272EU91_9RHOO|nr:hypothetical protein [Candidatus Dactylopiibacterium carminicum]KAF7599726.1 hypothetical protein BGI27_06485 [Candidatus Dactylopiibacterium carminicum]PAS93662.1 MAG: hypothetical protein CGU29_06925 [Candidatus Dactylopiibacterium carminicum]PAS97530.1 MAG: hypothetical protein CGU28_04855 [Candidatus Dactylopiibacterium carminicum]PAS99728.1 MAG: hypothetical protein BSR46_06520 [Candidatus Dactylopiibacterium carminicum]